MTSANDASDNIKNAVEANVDGVKQVAVDAANSIKEVLVPKKGVDWKLVGFCLFSTAVIVFAGWTVYDEYCKNKESEDESGHDEIDDIRKNINKK